MDPAPVNYGTKRRMHAALRFAIVVGIGFSLWCLALLLPFAFVGEYWAYLWFPLNLPLSAIVGRKYGIGSDSYGPIALVTMSNGAVVGFVVGAFALLASRGRKRS